MYVPVSWLRDFAPLPNERQKLIDACNELGLVIEGVLDVSGSLEGIVVGHVLELEAVPGADILRKATIDLGGKAPTIIACAATNLAKGQKVPVATVGTTLPNGMEIGVRKMKGFESNGMICAADEIGLAMKRAGGIMVLPADSKVGEPVAKALGLKDDLILDLAIETNRPDANCMVGVARDLAALFKVPFSIPEYTIEEKGPETSSLVSVDVQSSDLSPRFTARVLSDVVIGESDPQVQLRLTMAGMRPINNVVDASNYVMLELGQPSHPYDLDKVPDGGLIVRAAKVGESLVTLDGVERKFISEEDCLICDSNNTPIGIAGIMGGSSSEIDDTTTKVLLEAAYFKPMAIAWTSRRYSIRSEASARFERGCDPWGIERAVARFCSLVPGATISKGQLDVTALEKTPTTVWLRTDRVNQILGTHLEDQAVRDLLTPIGFECEEEAPGLSRVISPSFRPDATREADLIEEVARHYGYENFERTVPVIRQVGFLPEYQRNRRKLRDVLTGFGLAEAETPPLLSDEDLSRTKINTDPIRISNPMMSDETLLRPSLLPGLVKAVAYNVARQNPDIRLFEIGHVFARPEPGDEIAHEREHAAGAFAFLDDDATTATRAIRSLASSLRLSIETKPCDAVDGLHPSRVAGIYFGDKHIGVVGEIDPGVRAEFNIEQHVGYFEIELDEFLPLQPIHNIMASVSRYPANEIDLAFVVHNSVHASELQKTLAEAAGEWLESIDLFDVYRGAELGNDVRSLAYRLRFAAKDHTLTDEEVGVRRQACIDSASKKHSAQLRG